MAIFKNKDEYKKWIEENEWYQTMNLPSGLTINGKVPTQLREPLFDTIDFTGKSFLDIGCNSGQYCFMAKDRGAREVIGVDFDSKRINQARTIAENEKYDVRFEEKSIFDMGINTKFDIVFCIAVITEIQDTFGALQELKKCIGSYALIEISLARPMFYLSSSKLWLKGYPNMSRRTAVTEVRKIRGDKWIVCPSLDVLRAFFGEEFRVTEKRGGVRYNLVEVVRIAG